MQPGWHASRYAFSATKHAERGSGTLAYWGAIDSKPDSKTESIATATNYVARALDEILAGQSVSEPKTRPYGCSVKYAK